MFKSIIYRNIKKNYFTLGVLLNFKGYYPILGRSDLTPFYSIWCKKLYIENHFKRTFSHIRNFVLLDSGKGCPNSLPI